MAKPSWLQTRVASTSILPCSNNSVADGKTKLVTDNGSVNVIPVVITDCSPLVGPFKVHLYTTWAVGASVHKANLADSCNTGHGEETNASWQVNRSTWQFQQNQLAREIRFKNENKYSSSSMHMASEVWEKRLPSLEIWRVWQAVSVSPLRSSKSRSGKSVNISYPISLESLLLSCTEHQWQCCQGLGVLSYHHMLLEWDIHLWKVTSVSYSGMPLPVFLNDSVLVVIYIYIFFF